MAVPACVDVFVTGDQPGEYRIPSIGVTRRGTLLAFASDRKDVGDFGHDSAVVMRRSSDRGRTWGPLQVLASREGADIHHGPILEDRQTGRLYKFCRFWPAHRAASDLVSQTPYAVMASQGWMDHVLVSDDDGVTWSAPQPLPLPFPPRALRCGTGNGGHGIQLPDGRLLIQAGYTLLNGGRRTDYNAIVISDDHGRTWRFGEPFTGVSIREFVMAPLRGRRLYLNGRDPGARHQRWRGYSDDGGEHVTSLQPDPALPDPLCHAGIECLREAGDPVLVFCNPVGGEAQERSSFGERRRLVVRLSRDEGRSWPVSRTLTDGLAGYSDLAAAPDGTVYCLFEVPGDPLPAETVPTQRIVLAVCSPSWLRGEDEPAAGC